MCDINIFSDTHLRENFLEFTKENISYFSMIKYSSSVPIKALLNHNKQKNCTIQISKYIYTKRKLYYITPRVKKMQSHTTI